VHLNGLADMICHKGSFIFNGSHAFADVIFRFMGVGIMTNGSDVLRL
jgi:hypothetical protein